MKSPGLSRTTKRSRKSPQNAQPAHPGPRRRPHWKRGEDLAAEYLERLGFQILARNWRSTFTRNEIDLIARDGNCVVFVEVKSARTSQFGEPLAWITPRKQAAIIKAALAYVAQSDRSVTDFRFDAIAIAPSKTTGQPAINHVRSAFTCDVAGE